MNKAVVLMRKAPYGSVYAAEGFRSVMGIGIFEMDVALIFAEDGVYALLKEQNPEKLDMKPLGEGFPMLPEFDVNKFYVHQPSLEARGLSVDDLVMDVELVDNAGLTKLLAEYGKVIPF
ncbi:MAG: sulfurtransferase TusC [Anaerolineaceae bacterium 4572_32.1]|nr:MAG: sulfurtransferase TusC [Anaerolineaceae bacterium 4572_32.1]